MTSWLQYQREQIRRSLLIIRDKKELTVTQPFCMIDQPISDVNVLWTNENYFSNDPNAVADIYFNQGYSPDRKRLIYVRQSGRATFHATWFWDNHHLFADTMHATLLSDIYFCAHGYMSSYLNNNLALNGGFVPLCPVFWQMKEVELAATKAILAPRSDALYGGYNSYAEFPSRDVLIEQIRARIPNNNIFLTRHGTPPEQHPFYSMTPSDRMLEWMSYKVSLCLSFGNNTAMRIFDMLLGGGIPLIVGRPTDLDAIFPAYMQASLPIMVIEETDPDAVAEAYRESLARFESGGVDGIMTRHAYIKANHMPVHRLGQMIDKIRSFADQVDNLDYFLEN